MWNAIYYNRRPRLSRSTVGCYHARIVVSNIGCGVSKQLFLQQLASQQNTDHYTKKHFKKYDIQFQKFVRRIVEPPPGTNWSPQWHDILHEYARGLLGPCQWTFLLVKKVRDSILEFRFLHCKLTCRTLGEESTCVATTSNTSFPWMPTASLGH